MSRKQDFVSDSAPSGGVIHAPQPSSMEDNEIGHPNATATTTATPVPLPHPVPLPASVSAPVQASTTIHPVTTFYPPLSPSPMYNSYAYTYPYQGAYEVAPTSASASVSASASAEDPYQLGINMATNPPPGYYSLPGTPASMTKKSIMGGSHMPMNMGVGMGMNMGMNMGMGVGAGAGGGAGLGMAIQPTKLFIGQIPPTVTEDQLYKVMQQFGQVTEVVLVRRRMVDENLMTSTLSPNFGSPLSVGATRGEPLDSSTHGDHHHDDDPGDDDHHHDDEQHEDHEDHDHEDHDHDDKQQPENLPHLSHRSEESSSESAAVTDPTHPSSTTSSSSLNQQPTEISRIGSELEVAPDADADEDDDEDNNTGAHAEGGSERDRNPDEQQELAAQMQQQASLEDETPPRGPTHSTSSTTVASLPPSKLKICGFVKFATPESTVAAIEALHNKYVFPEAEDGAPIRVKYADQRKAFLRKGITKLFVGQLPKDISEEQLAHVFSMHGEIMHCHVLRYGGSSRGCGFVEYQTREQADRAILHMNGVCVFDPRRPLNVRYAESSNDKMVRKRFDSMSDIPSEAAGYDDGAQYSSSSSGTNRFGGGGGMSRSNYAGGSSSYKPPVGAMQQQQQQQQQHQHQQQRYGPWVDPSVNLGASIGMAGRQAHSGVGFPGSSSKGMVNPSTGLAQQSAASAASAAAANYYPQMMAYYPQYSNMAPYPVYFTPANPEDYVYYSNANGMPVQMPGMATNFGPDSAGSLAMGVSNLSSTPGASPAPYMTSPAAGLIGASGYPPYLSLENTINGMATTTAAASASASSVPPRYVSQGRTRSFGDHQGSKLG